MPNQKVESGLYEHHESPNESATKSVRKEGNESSDILESTILDPSMFYWWDVTTLYNLKVQGSR